MHGSILVCRGVIVPYVHIFGRGDFKNMVAKKIQTASTEEVKRILEVNHSDSPFQSVKLENKGRRRENRSR